MIADDMTWKEIKREVGELAHMEHEMLQARESRDHWKGKCERMERDLYERYVEFPKDANDATIRPGARVTHAGKLWVVWAIVRNEAGWLLDCQPRDGEPPAGRTVRPEDCVVVGRRTVEDVLRECAKSIEGQNEDFGSLVVKKYADLIRRMLDA